VYENPRSPIFVDDNRPQDAIRIAQATFESRTRREAAEIRFALKLAANSRPAHGSRQVVIGCSSPIHRLNC